LSRTIDPEKIASGDLSEDERRYLQDRGKLPKGVDGVEDNLDQPATVAEMAHTGTANTAGLTIEELEELLEKMKSEQQELPRIEDDGGIEELEDDEEEDLTYEEMNNDMRRAELSNRGLSVTGNKEELIARLRRSDADQLIEGDVG